MNNNWIATSGSWWTIDGNWDLGHIPTDDEYAIFSSGNNSCTIDVNISCSGITSSGTYSGSISFTGKEIVLKDGCYFNHSGSLTLGNKLTGQGPSGTIRFGINTTYVNDVACEIRFEGTTGMTLYVDKVLHFRQFTFANNAVVTTNGTSHGINLQELTYPVTNAPLNFEGYAIFTVNKSLHLYKRYSGEFIHYGGAMPLINGAAELQFTNYFANNQIIEFPGINYRGTGYIVINFDSCNTATFRCTGNVDCGTASLRPYMGDGASPVSHVVDFNDYNITCGELWGGVYGAGAHSLYYGNGNHVFSSYRNDLYNEGTTLEYYEGSNITCSGSWGIGSNHIINPGSGTVIIANTSTITSTNQPFNNLTIQTPAAGTVVTFNGSPKFSGNFNVIQGSTNFAALNWSGYGNITFSGTGNHTIGSGITLCNSGNFMLSSTLLTCISAGCYVKCLNDATLNLGTRTINRLGLTSAKNYFMTSGAPILTINSYTAGDWDGAKLYSTSPGSYWNIKAPIGIETNNISVSDSNNSTGQQINASTSRGNIDNGHNLNWDFAATATSRKNIQNNDLIFIINRILK
jgi:hypothetical protein